jgi:hypothetical protein
MTELVERHMWHIGQAIPLCCTRADARVRAGYGKPATICHVPPYGTDRLFRWPGADLLLRGTLESLAPLARYDAPSPQRRGPMSRRPADDRLFLTEGEIALRVGP